MSGHLIGWGTLKFRSITEFKFERQLQPARPATLCSRVNEVCSLLASRTHSYVNSHAELADRRACAGALQRVFDSESDLTPRFVTAWRHLGPRGSPGRTVPAHSRQHPPSRMTFRPGQSMGCGPSYAMAAAAPADWASPLVNYKQGATAAAHTCNDSFRLKTTLKQPVWAPASALGRVLGVAPWWWMFASWAIRGGVISLLLAPRPASTA